MEAIRAISDRRLKGCNILYLCEVHPDEVHPGEVHPDEVHPGEVHPGEVHPDEVHPGEVHPDEVHPGEVHPGGNLNTILTRFLKRSAYKNLIIILQKLLYDLTKL